MAEGIHFTLLPFVVQRKIIEEYVPAFTKAKILREIPELSHLFTQSWLNGSKTFLELFDSFRRIESGFYLGSKRNSYYVVFVSVNENTISFTHLSFKRSYYKRKLLYGQDRPETQESLPVINNFIQTFLSLHTFYKKKELKICYHRAVGHFFICYHDGGSIIWVDGWTYPLQECIDLPLRSKRVILYVGNEIRLEFYSKFIRDGKQKFELLSEETVDTFSLNSLFLIEGQPRSYKSSFKFEIELAGNQHALLRMKGLYKRAGRWFDCDLFRKPEFEQYYW